MNHNGLIFKTANVRFTLYVSKNLANTFLTIFYGSLVVLMVLNVNVTYIILRTALTLKFVNGFEVAQLDSLDNDGSVFFRTV